MGVDNDVRLVIGAVFDYESIKPAMFAFGVTQDDIDDQEQDALESFFDKAKKEFPSLFFGRASPYYDAEMGECAIYVSMHDPCLTQVALVDIHGISKAGFDAYQSFFERVKIGLEPAALFALPHIW